MKRGIKIIISVIGFFLVAFYLFKVLSPNQLERTIEDYFDNQNSIHKSNYSIYNTQNWHDGELVAIENNQMVGLIYLKKILGLYHVEDHVLSNKVDGAKSIYTPKEPFQYRLLRVQSFADDKDIIMAYVNDSAIKSLTLEEDFQELNFQLPDNRKLVFSETKAPFSIIKTRSDLVEEFFVEWEEKSIQDKMKYDTRHLVLTSNVFLNIAVVGEFYFKTDDSIQINYINLGDLQDLDSSLYDALFINARISNEGVDNLVKRGFDVCIINPFDNLDQSSNIDEDLIVIEKSNSGGGSCSKGNFYDWKTNYYSAFNHILIRISERKE